MHLRVTLLFIAVLAAGCRPTPSEHSASPEISTHAATQQTQNFLNPSWGNGRTMCLDPAASTSCSGGGAVADTNDCSCACTAIGVGPCLTWNGGLVTRWGTLEPIFNLNTQVDLVSSQSLVQYTIDPIQIRPILRCSPYDASAGLCNAAQFSFVGTPTVASTSTISATNFQAKNRTAGQGLRVRLASGAPTIPGLLQNTTHPSTAWTYFSQAGTGVTSQPMLWAASNFTQPASAEVDTWTIGDTINQLTLPTANITYITPRVDLDPTAENALVVVQDVHFTVTTSITSPADMEVFVGPYVTLIDDFSDEKVNVSGNAASFQINCGSTNVYYNGGFTGGLLSGYNSQKGGMWTMLGGVVEVGDGETDIFNGVWLDADLVMNTNNLSAGAAAFVGNNYVGLVENNWTTTVMSGTVNVQIPLYTTDAGSPDPCPGTGCNVVWSGLTGTGNGHTLNAAGGYLYYPGGLDGGGNTFQSPLITKVGGNSNCKASFPTGTADLFNQACATGANLDTLLSADAGCASNGGGAGFCNTPAPL